MKFFTKLSQLVAEKKTNLCVGIDPDLEDLPLFMEDQLKMLGDESFLLKLGNILIDLASRYSPAVKFQSAFFEARGLAGIAALKKLIKSAQQKKLLTILDAKRGDIGSTMKAYGRAAFDFLESDALTVTPYMGLDVLDALVNPWLNADRGAYIVWYSSNIGGALVQNDSAAKLLEAFANYIEVHQLYESCGLVVGATRVGELPSSVVSSLNGRPLLIPGVGAQGGMIDHQFSKVIASSGCSLINVSRAITRISNVTVKDWDEVGTCFEDSMRNYSQNLSFVQ